MIIRVFDTAVDPLDVEKSTELFSKVVEPAFEAFEGCHGIEMFVSFEDHSKDLVEILAVSRWESVEVIERATASDEYEEALTEIRALFQQTPIVRHFRRA